AARYSTHDSKSSQGRLGRVYEGAFHAAIGPQPLTDSLFFNDTTRLKAGQYSGVIPHAGEFLIVRVESHTPRRTPPLGEVYERVAGDYIRTVKVRLNDGAIDALKARHEVRLVSHEKEPTEAEIEAYYRDHLSEYMSP